MSDEKPAANDSREIDEDRRGQSAAMPSAQATATVTIRMRAARRVMSFPFVTVGQTELLCGQFVLSKTGERDAVVVAPAGQLARRARARVVFQHLDAALEGGARDRRCSR